MKKLVKGCCGCLCIFLGVILVLFLGLYVYSEWIWEEWPPSRIERITGVRVPKYNVIVYDQGERHFTGDYEDRYEIEFQTIPSEDLFDKIDNMIATGNTGWKKDGKEYKFSVTWGNGYPTPEGENEEADGIFSITITKGERNGEIRCGAW